MPSLNTGNAILSHPIKVETTAYNVGIGAAASSSFKLQVTGTTNLTGALTGTSATFSGNLGINTSTPDILGYGTKTFGILGVGSDFPNMQIGIPGTSASTTDVMGDINFYSRNGTGAVVSRSLIRSGLDGATNSNYFNFFTMNAGTLAERMRITSGGDVFINNSSGVSLNGLTNKLSISSTTYNLLDISRFSDNAFGPNFYLVKSRNASIGGNTIVASGDNLGNITWVGANGTGFTDAAAIRAEVDGTPGASNDMPGRLVFLTTADGAGSVTERMRITSGGNVLIGTTTDTGYMLRVTGYANIGGNLVVNGDATITNSLTLSNPTTYTGKYTSDAVTVTGGAAGGGGGTIIIGDSNYVGLLIVSISTQNCVGIFLISSNNQVLLVSQTTTETRFSTTAGTLNTANIYFSGSNLILENNIQATRNFRMNFIGKIA